MKFSRISFVIALCALGLFTTESRARRVYSLTPYSLARSYHSPVLKKAGDFNKGHIYVLTVMDGKRPVAVKIAGHAPSEVCAKVSRELHIMSNALEGRGAKFGDDYFLSYGLFNSPVNPRYSRVYASFTRKLKKIRNRYPSLIKSTTVQARDYNRYNELFKSYERLSRRKNATIVVGHKLPENHLAFVKQNRISKAAYDELLNKIKAQALSPRVTARLRKRTAALRSIMKEFRRIRIPVFIRHSRDFSGRRGTSVERAVDAALSSRSFLRGQRTVTRRLDQIAKHTRDLNEPAIKVRVDVMERHIRSFTGRKTMRRIMIGILSEGKQGKIYNLQIDWGSVRSLPRVARRLDFLNKVHSSLELSVALRDNLQRNHPHMLADSVIRAWPVLNPVKFSSLYSSGMALRRAAGMSSPYDFVALSRDGPTVYRSVSGNFVQIVRDGRSEFRNLESFVRNEYSVPPMRKILRMEAQRAGADGRPVLVSFNPGEKTASAPRSLSDFASEVFDARSIPQSLLEANPPRRLATLKELYPAASVQEIGGGFSDAATYRIGDRLVKIRKSNPRVENAESLVRHSIDRMTYNADFRNMVINLSSSRAMRRRIGKYRISVPARYEVRSGPGGGITITADEFLGGFRPATEKSSRPLTEAYENLQIAISRFAGKLEGSKIRKNPESYYASIRPKLLVGAKKRFGDNPRDWDNHFQRFLGSLIAVTEDSAKQLQGRKLIFQHDVNPRNVMVKDNRIALIDFDGDQKVPVGVQLAHIAQHSLAMRYGINGVPRARAVRAVLDGVIKKAVKAGIITARQSKDRKLKIELLMGIIKQGSSDSALRPWAGPGEIARINNMMKNIRQPLFEQVLRMLERQRGPRQFKFYIRTMRRSIRSLKRKNPGFIYLGNLRIESA